MSEPTPRTGNPELRRAYFDAAAEILGSEGYGALKLNAVCRALGVPSGSFYHSFRSWAEFTAAFLEHWRAERTTRLAELAAAQTDPVAALRVLAESTDSFQHRTEAAIRVWSAVDPVVAVVQRQVDDERSATVRRAVAGLVGEDEADHWTAWAMTVLVGFEMLSDRLEPEVLAWSLGRMLVEAAAEGRARATDA